MRLGRALVLAAAVSVALPAATAWVVSLDSRPLDMATGVGCQRELSGMPFVIVSGVEGVSGVCVDDARFEVDSARCECDDGGCAMKCNAGACWYVEAAPRNLGEDGIVSGVSGVVVSEADKLASLEAGEKSQFGAGLVSLVQSAAIPREMPQLKAQFSGPEHNSRESNGVVKGSKQSVARS